MVQLRREREDSVLKRMLASEAARHLDYARTLLEEARLHLGKDYQAFEKIFAAWKKLVAATLALLLIRAVSAGSLSGGNLLIELRKNEIIEEDEGRVRIVVTTGNAPKATRMLREYSSLAGSDLEDIIEKLYNIRNSKIYQLYYAFYEGSAAHAGFSGEEEALELARRVLEELEHIAARLASLLGL